MGNNVPNLGVANVETPARPTSLTVFYSIGTFRVNRPPNFVVRRFLPLSDLVLVESAVVVRYMIYLESIPVQRFQRPHQQTKVLRASDPVGHK